MLDIYLKFRLISEIIALIIGGIALIVALINIYKNKER